MNGGEQDDDIYQSPVEIGGMKRSETADNILDGNRQGGANGLGVASHLGIGASYSPRVTRHTNSSSPYMEPRRRPISQFISNEVKSASDILGSSQKSPRKNMDSSTSQSQLNPYPPPSNPAPPPPLRTVSKTVDPIG